MARKTNIEINGIKYFQIYPTITLPDGTKVRKKFYGVSKQDALKQKEEYLDGLKESAPDGKMGDVIDYWMYNVIRLDNKIKPQSFERYEGIYRMYIKGSVIASMSLTDISKQAIQNFYNRLYENVGLTKSQIVNLNKVLKKFFFYCIEEGLIEKNPCFKVAIPGDREYDDEEEIFIFTDDEIKRIESALEGNPDKLFVRFAFGTGMRMGELMALRHQDIENYTINVRWTLTHHAVIDKDGKRTRTKELCIPKSKSSIRTIPIPKYLREEYIPGDPEGFVFPNANGNFMEKSNFIRRWKKILEKADVPYKKFHGTRHTYITKLVQKGANLATVKELAGHGNIQMTMRYTHINMDDKRNAVDLLG